MIKKTLVALFALAWLGIAPAHASAGSSKTACTSDGFTCMKVYYVKDTLHSGIEIDTIINTCTQGGSGPVFGWDSPADDGHSLDVDNDTTGVTFWSLGESSNVYSLDSGCSNGWNVATDRPNSHSVTITWHFTEQLNALPDSDRTLTINIQNF